ncbi:MAG TPA: asparagine synthase (glutamine-hydrolyzing) [Bacteroidia bacterium]|nr:asparagine synthase (glutamine-hydrolyzing) [Bacteroidia bacterium]
MCGIAGIISSYVQKDKALTALQRMNNAIAHRGPDAEGVWSDDFAYLGHRRLSIIDLSDSGTQPLHSYDNRYVIIYNGELYNYKELRLQLQRAIQGTQEQPCFFKTQTDTEVVLAAYIRWGADCLHRFNGMFAFAIYDKQEKNIFIARDRMGIKPLYYSFQNNTLVFASELRAVLQSNLIDKKINQDALVDYLQYQTVHAPNTMVNGVKMLLPGHYLSIENKDVKTQAYWQLEKNINYASIGKSYEDICKDVRTLFYEAVERRLVADVPFGAFLSGGIDSSAIVGAMSKISSQQVKTFSVVFNESEFSEAHYARIVSEKFKTDHHEIKLSPEDFLNQLPEALNAMDHPSGDGPNSYIVSKATKKAGITMALSGLGSDEIFCGYDIFKRSYKLEQQWWLNFVPRILRVTGAAALTSFNKNIASQKLAQILAKPQVSFNYAYPLLRQVLLDKQVKQLLQRSDLPMNSVYRFLRLLEFDDKNHRLSKYSIAEISTYMQNVLLRDTDQMSMASALEVRVPFLDYKLVEYVLGVSDKHKYPRTPKKLLTDSLQDLLPSEIMNRKKMGFVLPWQLWMKNELKQFCEENLLHLEELGFNQNTVNNLWKLFLKGDPQITWSRIWLLVTLGNWQKNLK